MGLDASVMCNCYAEGRVPAPHFAKHLYMSEEGFLELNAPYDENEDLFLEFDLWRRESCPHDDMDEACEYIANWNDYRSFMMALEGAGWDHFPTLERELPHANGGQTSPEAAEQILAELDYLSNLEILGNTCVLLNAETRKEVFEATDDTGEGFVGRSLRRETGLFQRMGSLVEGGNSVFDGRTGLMASIDKAGFCIREADGETWKEIFRSHEFQQTLLEPSLTEGGEPGRVRFVDLATGTVCECRLAVPSGQIPWPDGAMENEKGKVRRTYPRHFVIGWHRRTPSDYEPITTALRIVCEAAIRTGNPIRWT